MRDTKTLAPIIDSQYRTDRTYPKPKPRDEPRVPFYQRGRVKQIVVVIQAKSEAFAKEHAR
jgi:hypothetical protein